ncbi:MAG TPA: HEAT repeat domain-containing protein [Gemmataceae bacterium]|nr:HEAT repeat domain-containing protein [Gemmataceae bacterium]
MRVTLIASCGLLLVATAPVFAQVPVPGPFPPTVNVAPPAMTIVERNRNLVPTLLDALKDKDETIRRNATEALRGLGSDAIPSLLEVLRGNDQELRVAAAILLGNMGPKAEVAMPALLRILRNKKEPAALRQAASKTIALMLSSGPVSKAGSAGGELQLASFTTGSRGPDLVEGTWRHRVLFGDKDIRVTIRCTARRLTVTCDLMSAKGQPVTCGAAVDADYAVTKDGLLFGVVTSIRRTQDDQPPADASRLSMESWSDLLDKPFCIRVRKDGERMTIHSLDFGTGPEQRELHKAEFAVLEGTYQRQQGTP